MNSNLNSDNKSSLNLLKPTILKFIKQVKEWGFVFIILNHNSGSNDSESSIKGSEKKTDRKTNLSKIQSTSERKGDVTD